MTPEQAAAMYEAQQQAESHYVATLPRCASDQECQLKWLAARRWMLDNCGFKLEHVRDDFLETYRSGDTASMDLWCRVTKEPAETAGAYHIRLEAGVNNPFSSAPSLSTRQSFNDAVNAAWGEPK